MGRMKGEDQSSDQDDRWRGSLGRGYRERWEQSERGPLDFGWTDSMAIGWRRRAGVIRRQPKAKQ